MGRERRKREHALPRFPFHCYTNPSNACWQCAMSPSDLKHLETPDWIDPRKGEPT